MRAVNRLFINMVQQEYIYISTNHIGLYEKYGYEFFQMMKDVGGEDSRVYRKAMDSHN